MKCSICGELVTNKGRHHATVLKCGHIFGSGCILQWLNVCRMDIERFGAIILLWSIGSSHMPSVQEWVDIQECNQDHQWRYRCAWWSPRCWVVKVGWNGKNLPIWSISYLSGIYVLVGGQMQEVYGHDTGARREDQKFRGDNKECMIVVLCDGFEF